MYRSFRSAVIIPCYKIPLNFKEVLDSIPDFVDIIIVVDDACPNDSVQAQLSKITKKDKIIYRRHLINQGVGGAFYTGYKIAQENKVDLIAKIDGDGQHVSDNLFYYFDEIIDGSYDFMKGNRFTSSSVLNKMPFVRLLGNSCLSLICKVASGYWSVMDPTFGKFATSISCLDALTWKNIEKRYTFETSLICTLSLEYAKIGQVRERAIYTNEKSNLRPGKMILPLLKVCSSFFAKRYFQKNFVRTFTVNTFLIPVWLLVCPFTVHFTYSNWQMGIELDRYTAPGTVGIALLLSLIAILLPVLVIIYDVVSEPREIQGFLKLK